jgi:hypothetical protein
MRATIAQQAMQRIAERCNLRVVVQDQHRYAAEERKRGDMCITERLGCLGGVRLQKTRI